MVNGFAVAWDGRQPWAGAAMATAESVIGTAVAIAVHGRGRMPRFAAAYPEKAARAMAMDEADDQQLMTAVAEGDERAFRILAVRHLAWALRLAGRLTGNPADAEDIVQEAMLRVWTNAPRWQPAARFRTWFYRVVVNLALDWRRRRPFAALDEAGEPADPNPDPQAALDQRQTARRVAAAIAALPERQRVALVLTYFEELSNAEVAGLLGASVGGIEGLLVRARRALRLRLGPASDKDNGKEE